MALAGHCLHKANICFGIHPITFLRIVFCLFSISISLLAVCRAAVSKVYLAKYPKVILIGYGDPWDNSDIDFISNYADGWFAGQI